MASYTVSWGNRRLVFDKKTLIMGVLNITPDSFSDGGKFYSFDRALAQGKQLIAAGADILDVGGESTRPFSDPVPVEEEVRRVVPVIERLASMSSIPISIDTTKASVARKALEAGASIINDVSSLRLDPDMAGLAVEYDVPVILMHMLGTPKTMQVAPAYKDLIGEIKSFLEQAVANAVKAGIPKSRIIIDPGIGFGKTLENNLSLIRNLGEFGTLGVPILIGPSRKAFIRTIFKEETGQDVQPDLPIVEAGTQAAVAASILNGAHMVRVHKVAETWATVKIVDAIKYGRNRP